MTKLNRLEENIGAAAVKLTPEDYATSTLLPPTLAAVRDPDDLRRLLASELPRHRPQNHFLYFHRPLPGDP